MLFDDEKIRKDLLMAYGTSNSTIKRAIGWAIFYGVILISASVDGDASYVKMGKRILKNISESGGY